MKPVAQQRSHAASVDPPFVALTERRLAETVDRCLERPELARRVGVLAAIDVAESPQLRSRFGPKAEQVVRAVLGEVIARGGQTSEQHSPRQGGGFWILLPETGFYAADQRLRELSRQVAEAVVDVNGERLRVTPVVGYATFGDATSARELCDQASAALHDACRHLDLVPVKYSRAIAFASTRPAGPRDQLMGLVERFWSPLQVGLILSVMLEVPFIAYVLSWRSGFDLTTVAYPLLAVSLGGAAIAIWIASFRIAASSIENLGTVAPVASSVESERKAPPATAIVAAHLAGESTTILDTVTSLLDHDYPGELQVILAYNAPDELPIEASLSELAAQDPRLMCLRVEEGTSKAECVSAALAYVSGEFVGIFDADSHLEKGSFSRASLWLSCGHDIVQGHRVVRNGEVSWVTRLVAVDYESTQALTGPRAGLDDFGAFGGSNVYWRIDALRQIGSQGSLQDTFDMASDPLLLSSELAPTTLRALWRQRIHWARASVQTVGPKTSGSGWMQTVSWLSLQVVPILGFFVWRDGGLGKLSHLIPLFVVLAVFILSMGVSQGAVAYLLANPLIKRHRPWFVLYAFHSAIWFGEFKDLIGRVARSNGAAGERRAVATDSEAVRLFLERASERVPGFTLNHHNASTVASICRRLEGMPLAIELAAARAATMDLNDIEARLDKRLSLLTDGTRKALPRQQTLRAVVDWSYDLLSERERVMLCRLSAFAGGWNLAAAQAVVVTENTDVFTIADVLGSLVDKSLVQIDQSAFGPRYSLPETIRRFAAEKLAESSDEELELRSAHARFFLEFAENSGRELREIPEMGWLDRLEADHDNLLAAIGTFLADPSTGSAALRIIMVLFPFFAARHAREWLEVFTAALNVEAGERANNTLTADALGVLGVLAKGPEQRRCLEEALAIVRSLGESALKAEILSFLSSCAFHDGDVSLCAESAEEAVSIARIVGDQGLLGRALVSKATAVSVEDLLEACAVSREAITALRVAGDRSREVAALANLATFERYAGDLQSAAVLYSEALVLAEELGDTPAVNDILVNMGELAVINGDLVSEAELYSRAHRGADRNGHRRSCT